MTHSRTASVTVESRTPRRPFPGLALALAFVMAPVATLSAAGDDAAKAKDKDKDKVNDSKDVIRDSVGKISVSTRGPNPLQPWTRMSPRDASGTGLVIEGKRILTNAHVVSYASQIFVESSESSDKHVAEVVAVSPGIDLAVIKLEDESFFDKHPPLPRTHELPSVKDSVLAYGYPQGGSSLSVTKGIVSRIEFAPYGEGAAGLRVQVDAAINPGNSGGPALIDGKVVGLIFSRLNQADNIGYIIPTEEIDLFLDDVKDGKYDGKPMMYDRLQTLENDALRSLLKLDRKTSGMVVQGPDRDSADYPLKKWDLITRIGDHEIDSTGLVKVKDDLRLRFQYLTQKLTKDGKVPLTVIRKGKEIKVELPVSSKHEMLVESLQGRYPSYFVYGPLVFAPVTSEFLSGFDRAGNQFYALLSLIGSPLVTRRGDRPTFRGEELVAVTAPMFAHRIGKGYDNPFAKVVKEVNGVKIKNLRHLVELLRDTKETFTSISFNDRASETIVFNHKDALAATEDVLNDNGIRQRASDDISAVWNGKAAESGSKPNGGEKSGGGR
jgi:S1-C subfamily serine protease